MNSFVEMPDAYVQLAKAVHRTGRRVVKDETVNMQDAPNVAVVPLYLKGQHFPFHRDNVYTSKGEFDTAKNSQQLNSLVYGVSIGPTRILIMQLMRHPTKKEYEEGRKKPVPIKGAIYKFELAHGTLFILHPADEECRMREEHKGCMTFWQHKVNKQKEMTLGVVLRTCTHFREVNRTTGVLHLSPEDEATDRDRFQQNYDMLSAYFSPANYQQKKIKDDEIINGWAHIKQEYYDMPAAAEASV